jgi:hypothetical protein
LGPVVKVAYDLAALLVGGLHDPCRDASSSVWVVALEIAVAISSAKDDSRCSRPAGSGSGLVGPRDQRPPNSAIDDYRRADLRDHAAFS